MSMFVLFKLKAEQIFVLRPKYGKQISIDCRRMSIVRALVILARCHCKPFTANTKYMVICRSYKIQKRTVVSSQGRKCVTFQWC